MLHPAAVETYQVTCLVICLAERGNVLRFVLASWVTSSHQCCWWMLLWVLVALKVIQVAEEVVVLGGQVRELVHRRVQ
jgi:hypothetical protein